MKFQLLVTQKVYGTINSKRLAACFSLLQTNLFISCGQMLFAMNRQAKKGNEDTFSQSLYR